MVSKETTVFKGVGTKRALRQAASAEFDYTHVQKSAHCRIVNALSTSAAKKPRPFSTGCEGRTVVS